MNIVVKIPEMYDVAIILHCICDTNYISFVGRHLDAAKSIGQKFFVELNNNFKSLTEKASSKDNYNATFKELNP